MSLSREAIDAWFEHPVTREVMQNLQEMKDYYLGQVTQHGERGLSAKQLPVINTMLGAIQVVDGLQKGGYMIESLLKVDDEEQVNG